MRWFFGLLCLTSCMTPSQPNTLVVRSTTPAERSVIKQTVAELSSNLGFAEIERSRLIDNGHDQLFLTPLEAEDEIRFLITFSFNRQHKALVCGLAEPDIFSEAYAERSSVYDGWLFYYDLGAGQRIITRYYEGGSLTRSNTTYPVNDLPSDLLSEQRYFDYTSLYSNQPPRILQTSIFSSSDQDQHAVFVFREVAALLAAF